MKTRPGCIEVRYEVSDGYVGGSRPQSFMLCEEDLFDGSVDPTEEGVLDMLYERTALDMEAKVEPSLLNEERVMEWAMSRIEERQR